ncbi:hypothetical protein Tco_0495803 [Tanacetum coccineum]
MTTPSNNSQMHNDIMTVGSRERPLILAPVHYAQWSSRFMRYVDTKSNKDQLRHCIKQDPYILTEIVHEEVQVTKEQQGHPRRVEQETYVNTTPKNIKLIDVEDGAMHMILNGTGDDIYSTVDACSTAREMWLAIERLHQGESINKQDVKTKFFWEFGKFISRDGESIESYYLRFYKMMNEMSASKEDSNPEHAQRDKDMQKNLALIAKYIKNIYKPTNNNLRTSSNTRNKTVDTTPISGNDKKTRQFGNQRTMTIANARETIGPTYDYKPLEKLHSDDNYNVFATEKQHFEQPESINGTYMVETVDSNGTPDSLDMCDNEGHVDQNAEESKDERVLLASLIANFKLDTDENKKFQKQLKKANTSLTQDLEKSKQELEKNMQDLEKRKRDLKISKQDLSYCKQDLVGSLLARWKLRF